jgi:hypothetical protein
MLLSMFHVSFPSRTHKYWLHAVLKYLFKSQDKILANNYVEFLEQLAKAFMLDRFLASDNSQKDYKEIIYENDCKPKNQLPDKLDCLDKGTQVEHFIFNYLDYILWLNKNQYNQLQQYAKEFKFTFRDSVEHFYPRNPKK